MTTRLSGIALAGLLIAALGVTACGGDDGEKENPASRDDDDKKPDSDGRSVGCGPTTCKPREGFTGEMCCQDEFGGVCGQMVAGTCTDLPPEPHETCESTTFTAGGGMVMVPSCCVESTNECGLVFNAGIGSPTCTSIRQAQQFGARFMAMGMGGNNVMFNLSDALPEAKTCDGDPIEMGAAGSGG